RAAGRRGSASSPQADRLHLEAAFAVWTVDLEPGVPVQVDALVEVLEVSQVAGVQVLDGVGVDVLQAAEPGDDPGQQDDDQVAGVGPDPGVPDRLDLVQSRGH